VVTGRNRKHAGGDTAERMKRRSAANGLARA